MSMMFQELRKVRHFLYVADLKPLVYILMSIAIIAILYGLYRHWRLWFHGGEKPSFDRPLTRIGRLLLYGLLQLRVASDGYAGLMHLSLYIGCLGLGLATVTRSVDYYLFHGSILLGQRYLYFKLMADVSGLLMLVGVLMALFRRILRLKEGLSTSLGDILILLDLLAILVTGFLLDGLMNAAYRRPWIDPWTPIGTPISNLFMGWSASSIKALYRPLWVLHLTLAMGTMAVIPYTKLSHLLVGGFLNLLLSRLEEPNTFKPIPEIYRIVEEGGVLGVSKLSEVSWRERLDYDSCVECARCHEVCPARISGKPLSPMEVMTTLRDAMNRGLWDEVLTPGRVEASVIWSCVTCGACVAECPLLLNQVETLIDLRRGLYISETEVPREVQELSYNIMSKGNPYGFPSKEREDWLRSLVDQGLAEWAREGEHYDYIYWIGCATAYDPELRGCAEALLKALKKAGLRVAILDGEICCGEPARKVGDELMFVESAKMVAELLSKYSYESIITSCPHCYNALKNEYRGYGYSLRVESHVEALSKLVKRGILKLKPLEMRVTYHDPCYLSRWNGLVDEPRGILEALGVRLLEMPRRGLKALCCGGGGGQAFYEVEAGERISTLRIREALETGAEALVVACPHCHSMFRGEELPEGFRLYDIAELVAMALE